MVAASKYLFFAIFPKKLSQRKSNAEQALRYNLFAVCVEDTLHHVYKDCHVHKYPTSPKVWEKSELLLYTWRHSSTVPPISCRSLSDWLVRELSLQNHCLRWTLATRSCSMSAFSPQVYQLNPNRWSMIIWLPGFPPARVNERRIHQSSWKHTSLRLPSHFISEIVDALENCPKMASILPKELKCNDVDQWRRQLNCLVA